MTTWAVEPNGLTQDPHLSRVRLPGPKTSEQGGLPPLAAFIDQGNELSAQTIKASASAVAIATSVGLIFALSWVGLALLGY
jgi:hypothetical protein